MILYRFFATPIDVTEIPIMLKNVIGRIGRCRAVLSPFGGGAYEMYEPTFRGPAFRRTNFTEAATTTDVMQTQGESLRLCCRLCAAVEDQRPRVAGRTTP